MEKFLSAFILCALLLVGQIDLINAQFGGFSSGGGGGFSSSQNHIQAGQFHRGGFSNGFGGGGGFGSSGSGFSSSSSQISGGGGFNSVRFRSHDDQVLGQQHQMRTAYAQPPPPVPCPQNILIGCAPSISRVPCVAPPPPPPGY